MFTTVFSLPHSQDGKQQEWGPGEVCGEAALIRSENRHTALLAGPQGARVLSLKRDSLEAILSCPLADYKSLRTSRRSVPCTLLSRPRIKYEISASIVEQHAPFGILR